MHVNIRRSAAANTATLAAPLLLAFLLAAALRLSLYAAPVAAQAKNIKVVGAIATKPDNNIGVWELLVAAQVTVTVVVTTDTKLEKFDKPPVKGDWVEVRGEEQPGGAVLAKKVRPNKHVPSQVVARLTSSAEITGVIDRYGLSLVKTLLSSADIYLFAGDDNMQEEAVLRRMADDQQAIVWAEYNYVDAIPSDPEGNPYRTWKWGSGDNSGYVNQAALPQVNLTPAQGLYTGAGVVVAVLDTGIDASHPAFAGRLLPGRDLVTDDGTPQDGPEAGEPAGLAVGHGTHVSGIVARIAPECKILPVRVLDANGRGDTYVLAYAIEWAAAHGAAVINLSLGSDANSRVLSDTIAAVQQAGVVVVAAAGNDDTTIPQYPASFPGVLGVTALDENNHKANFANYGPFWVDIAAPGVGITSTVPVSLPVLYGAWSGTSMAAPFVAGAAALVKQQAPTATVEAIDSQLIGSGRSVAAANPGYAGQLGRLLDIGAALGLTAADPTPPDLRVYLPAVLRPN